MLPVQNGRKKDAEWIEKFTAYLILFVISLLAVSHILPYGVPFALVFFIFASA